MNRKPKEQERSSSKLRTHAEGKAKEPADVTRRTHGTENKSSRLNITSELKAKTKDRDKQSSRHEKEHTTRRSAHSPHSTSGPKNATHSKPKKFSEKTNLHESRTAHKSLAADGSREEKNEKLHRPRSTSNKKLKESSYSLTPGNTAATAQSSKKLDSKGSSHRSRSSTASNSHALADNKTKQAAARTSRSRDSSAASTKSGAGAIKSAHRSKGDSKKEARTATDQSRGRSVSRDGAEDKNRTRHASGRRGTYSGSTRASHHREGPTEKRDNSLNDSRGMQRTAKLGMTSEARGTEAHHTKHSSESKSKREPIDRRTTSHASESTVARTGQGENAGHSKDTVAISKNGKSNHRVNNKDRHDKENAGKDETAKDKTSKDKHGKDKTSKDKLAKDITGKDETAKDKTGKDKHGLGKTGKDKHGLDKTGKNKHGLDKTGKDKHGLDKTGKDKHGLDKTGKDKIAKDKQRKDHHSKDKHGKDKPSEKTSRWWKFWPKKGSSKTIEAKTSEKGEKIASSREPSVAVSTSSKATHSGMEREKSIGNKEKSTVMEKSDISVNPSTKPTSVLQGSSYRVMPLKDLEASGLLTEDVQSILSKSSIPKPKEFSRSPKNPEFYKQTILGGQDAYLPLVVVGPATSQTLGDPVTIEYGVRDAAKLEKDELNRAFLVDTDPHGDDRWEPNTSAIDQCTCYGWSGAMAREALQVTPEPVDEISLEVITMAVRDQTDLETFVAFPILEHITNDEAVAIILESGKHGDASSGENPESSDAISLGKNLSAEQVGKVRTLSQQLSDFLSRHDKTSEQLATPMAFIYVEKKEVLNARLRSLYGRDLDGNTTESILGSFYASLHSSKQIAAGAIAESWENNEMSIFQECRKKYNVDPMGTSTKELIKKFYQRIDPEREDYASSIFSLFHGDENEINRFLRHRYGCDTRVVLEPM